jgi:ChrR-like protein with cupin domain
MAGQKGKSAFDAAILAWDPRLEDVGDALGAEAPSSKVWERVSARIDELQTARETLTIAANTGVWEPTAPGVSRKLLHVDADAGWQAFFLRLDPGARLAAHDHPILEECLVLEGAFEVAGEEVRKGDLHLAFAGSRHGDIVSPGGALIYIRASI